MHVRVQVSPEVLRGVAFKEYDAVLGNLIGEGFMPDDWSITLGDKTEVLVDGDPDCPAAREISAMAEEITDPEVMDGYFG